MNEASFNYFVRARELIDRREPFVTVTLVAHRGHAPQDTGAKMLVTPQGLFEGTVGGGKIEARAIRHALALLESGGPAGIETWNLQRDLAMSCGGEVVLFFEPQFIRRWPVVVFGAGHVAQALVPLLAKLDCSLTCVDPREEWIAKLPDSPRLTKVVHSCPAEFAGRLPANYYIAVMTQGHATDFPILQAVLINHLPPYIGVLGSPVKAAKIRAELQDCGVPIERIERLHCPMGLALGDNSPMEIAISVAAQMLQIRGNSDGHWQRGTVCANSPAEP